MVTYASPLWIFLYPSSTLCLTLFVLKEDTQEIRFSFTARQTPFSCLSLFLFSCWRPISASNQSNNMSREIRSPNLSPSVSITPSAAAHMRNKFWDCSYEELYTPFFFFIGSWISGEVGTEDASIGSDSSVDTSTTVSVITSGLMAAWMNSGFDTQRETKVSTMSKGRKGRGGSIWWSFYLIILVYLPWNYFNQRICSSIAKLLQQLVT